MKASPKKVERRKQVNLLPSLNSELQEITNLNKLNSRIKEEPSSNLINISDKIEKSCFSAHKRKNKENKFFKIIPSESKNEQIPNSYFDNKKLLTNILKNQGKQMLRDSSFSSEKSTEVFEKFQRKEEIISKIQLNLNCTGSFNTHKDINQRIQEAETLKGFYFMPLNNGNVEIVEIPT